jgi:precorrin-2/cobalt-factor-2 C20-methyltransferase
MVSLGPGDPNLLSLRGLELLRDADAIAIPTKSADRRFDRSLTHRIVAELMERYGFDAPKVPVYAPMKQRTEDWEAQVDTLMEAMQRYGHVVFVTLGDAAIYSTVYYLLEIIARRDPAVAQSVEVVPGITSFSQASARIKRPLCVGESALQIIPLVAPDAPKTTVYMRPQAEQTTDDLPIHGTMVTFENLNFADETITQGAIQKVRRYMTLLIDFVAQERR